MNNQLSVLGLAGGGVGELLDYEMKRLLDNVTDPNTQAKKKRSLTLKVEVEPNEARNNATVNIDVKSSLAPTSGIKTYLYISEDDEGQTKAQELLAPGYDPNQGKLFDHVDTETGEVVTRRFEAVK